MDLFRILTWWLLWATGVKCAYSDFLAKQEVPHADALFKLGHMERLFMGLSPLLQLQTDDMPQECIFLVLACKNARKSAEDCNIVKQDCAFKLKTSSGDDIKDVSVPLKEDLDFILFDVPLNPNMSIDTIETEEIITLIDQAEEDETTYI